MCFRNVFMVMESLDNDSLLYIFNELHFREKIRLERVCKRWQRILRSHAAYSTMESINIADYVSERKAARGDYQEAISGLVERAGPHIRELDFSHRWPLIPKHIIEQIAQKCAQLTRLDMGWVRLEADISPLLDEVAPQLEDFSLEETSWANPRHAERVVEFFPKMRQLRRLNLRKFDAPLDDLIKLDSGTIEVLDVSEASQLDSDTLCQFLDSNPQLLVLHLCPMPPGCLPLVAMSTTSSFNIPGPFLGFVRPPKQARIRIFSKEGEPQPRTKKKCRTDLQVLLNKFGSLKRLRTLWLGHIPYSAHFLSLNALADMAALRHLHIKEINALDGNTFEIILKGLAGTLRQLSLLNCRQLDDFSSLSHCEILSQLDVEKGVKLKNADLEALGQHGKLRILRVNECPSINGETIWNIIKTCPNLKELEMIKLPLISANLFANSIDVFANAHKLERLSLQGCPAINCQAILKAIEVLPLDTLNQLDVSRNMDIDDSILEPIWTKLDAEKQKRGGKPLILHVASTGFSREFGKKYEPLIELLF